MRETRYFGALAGTPEKPTRTRETVEMDVDPSLTRCVIEISGQPLGILQRSDRTAVFTATDVRAAAHDGRTFPSIPEGVRRLQADLARAA